MSAALPADVRVAKPAVLMEGPMAVRVLAALGAEVIMVEPPGRDSCRGLRITYNLDAQL